MLERPQYCKIIVLNNSNMLVEYINFDDIQVLLTVIVLSMLFAFLISFPIIKVLYKFNITRRMDIDFSTLIEDREQKSGVPIMGGLVVVLTVLILTPVLNPFWNNNGILLLMFIFLLSAFLGGFDDVLNIFGKKRKQRAFSRTLMLMKVHKSKAKRFLIFLSLPWEAYKRFFYILGSNPGKGIQSHEKILVQSISGLALGFGLYYFASREVPGLLWLPVFDVELNIGFLIIPFAWLTVLLMTNAVNISDGMDGLSTTEMLPSFFVFMIIAVLKDDVRTAILLATVIGSLLSYFYFNVPPARFQMGDVGSLALGALLAAVAFILGEPLMLLIVSFPFVITLLSVVIQGLGRRILGRRIFRMAPIHYHLQMSRDWSEEKVVMRLALLSAFTAVIGLWIFMIQR